MDPITDCTGNCFTLFKRIFVNVPHKVKSNFGKQLYHTLSASKCQLQYTNHCPPGLIISLLDNQDFNFSVILLLLLPIFFPSRHTYKTSVSELSSFPNHAVFLLRCQRICK